MRRRLTAAVALAGAALMTVTACGGGSDEPAEGGPVELTWWHNGNDDPALSYYQSVADAYTRLHPDVTFRIEPTQNESLQTKIQVGLQSNDPPDIFQQWGGGDLATQVEAGRVQDVTETTRDVVATMGAAAEGWQVDGAQYGIPYSFGVVGFWYRTDLFSQAGITAPPTTMDELYQAIDQLKAAGITPIALGGRDEWPDAFYWGALATRECSQEALRRINTELVFDDPCLLRAGQGVQRLIAAEPFQEGFLATPAQEGATSSAGLIATGQAAMELQGQWNSSTIAGLTPDGQPLGEELGWFPFPAVPGGEGDPQASFGGGDGFSCSSEAPPQCGDFLAFLVNAENQRAFAPTGIGLPTNPEALDAVTDPTVQGVLEARAAAPYNQLYFDRALPTAVGQALNSEIARMFAGEAAPESILAVATDAAAAEQ